MKDETSAEEKRFTKALDQLDATTSELAYVQGQRDGMVSIITMVLLSIVACFLIRRIYGSETR